ncbi:uncharacterized protein RBU33_006115 [Hipposideros larvatus]
MRPREPPAPAPADRPTLSGLTRDAQGLERWVKTSRRTCLFQFHFSTFWIYNFAQIPGSQRKFYCLPASASHLLLTNMESGTSWFHLLSGPHTRHRGTALIEVEETGEETDAQKC